MHFSVKSFLLGLSIVVSGVLFLSSCGASSNNKGNANNQNDTTQIKTANQKPDVSFKDESGKIITLSSLKGKVVFINFWATWCPPCKAELPSINKLKKAYEGNKDIVFLMVDVNEPIKTAKDFVTKNNYDLPVFVPEGDIPTDFVDNAIPSTVILDKEGKMVKHIVGASDYGSPEIKQLLDRLIAGAASGVVKE